MVLTWTVWSTSAQRAADIQPGWLGLVHMERLVSCLPSISKL